MEGLLLEWLNLLVRWVHVIAAIMWIGDSFLFMWLDSHLTQPTRQRDGEVVGELWMTHSGGFYEVIKRKSLAPGELPPTLHWFKWESYTTWLTGALLLVIVYWSNSAALLVDPTVARLTSGQAVALSAALLPAAWLGYELLWRTPLARDARAFGAAGLVLVCALGWGLMQLFSARAAFLQVGATLGTVMAANVFFRIIPAQKHMLAMTRAGQPVDTRHGARAKGRSIHNHYLTLPVLFTMVSNHFPSTYGSAHPALVLGAVVAFGVGLKYAMNHRRRTHPLALAGTLAALVGAVVLTRPASAVGAALEAYKHAPPVDFAAVDGVLQLRCATCHAARPTSPMFPAPPLGVSFDTADDIRRHAERIFLRATATRTMPLANMTAMTDQERSLIGAWFAQGAKVGELSRQPLAPSNAGPPPGVDRVAYHFATTCQPCHGVLGAGDGLAAAALTPKPRNFRDPQWQQQVTDDHLRRIILQGGEAAGKSATMPAQPQLAEDPELLDGLVKLIRSFGTGR